MPDIDRSPSGSNLLPTKIMKVDPNLVLAHRQLEALLTPFPNVLHTVYLHAWRANAEHGLP